MIGVFFTALVTVYQIRKHTWSENVSKERMKGINEFRKEVEKILKGIKYFKYENSKDIDLDIILGEEEAKYKLILELTRIVFLEMNTISNTKKC